MVILLKVRVRIDRLQLLADIAIYGVVHKCHDVLSPTQRTRTRRVVASRRFTRLTNGSPSTISAAFMNRSAVRPRWRLRVPDSSERPSAWTPAPHVAKLRSIAGLHALRLFL